MLMGNVVNVNESVPREWSLRSDGRNMNGIEWKGKEEKDEDERREDREEMKWKEK